MRRTSGTTLLEQARLLSHLLKSSTDRSLRHHAGEVASYFLLLHERVLVTHSVKPGLRTGPFPHPDELLGSGPDDELPMRVARSKGAILSVLDGLVERLYRIEVKPDAQAAP